MKQLEILHNVALYIKVHSVQCNTIQYGKIQYNTIYSPGNLGLSYCVSLASCTVWENSGCKNGCPVVDGGNFVFQCPSPSEGATPVFQCPSPSSQGANPSVSMSQPFFRGCHPQCFSVLALPQRVPPPAFKGNTKAVFIFVSVQSALPHKQALVVRLNVWDIKWNIVENWPRLKSLLDTTMLPIHWRHLCKRQFWSSSSLSYGGPDVANTCA